jgi:hypothetical protein
MKSKKLGSNQILKIVLKHDKMSEMFAQECQERRLKFSTTINGGSKIGSKRVGVQKFHNEQLSIARSVYYRFQNQDHSKPISQTSLKLF